RHGDLVRRRTVDREAKARLLGPVEWLEEVRDRVTLIVREPHDEVAPWHPEESEPCVVVMQRTQPPLADQAASVPAGPQPSLQLVERLCAGFVVQCLPGGQIHTPPMAAFGLR